MFTTKWYEGEEIIDADIQLRVLGKNTQIRSLAVLPNSDWASISFFQSLPIGKADRKKTIKSADSEIGSTTGLRIHDKSVGCHVCRFALSSQ